MSMQRTIEFETTSDDGAARVSEALASAFGALHAQRPEGVRLAYWRVPGGRRFLGLIELTDENRNPLAELEATRELPGIIGRHVDGGYPRPEIVEPIGDFGFDL